MWLIGSAATLGTTTAFSGSILAATAITLNTGVSITSGRALAGRGAVSLDSNNVSIGAASAVAEPATWALLLAGFAVVGRQLRRRRAIGAEMPQ